VKQTLRPPIAITARLLTKNWTLNLAGQTVSLLVAVPTIPYLVHGLGAERFGILSLAWVLLGYFGLFDLGLGRATTKFVAGCLGSGETHRLASLVWTSLWSQVLLGVIGAVVAASATPILVHRALKISPALVGETETSFYILAASLPLVLAANSLRGVLEAGQRFDLINYVRVPANASLFLLPTIAVLFGATLPVIVELLVLARLGSGFAYLLLCFKVYPLLRRDWSVDLALCRPLLAYGGWITVSNFTGPLLSYLDRFAIGSVISMAAVGYYTAPSEAINRLSFIPSSLSTTIFPAFSSLEATQSRARLEELCVRSLKALLLTLGPITLLLILFAQEILRLWLGSDFAARGAAVLQILAAGALLNSLAFVPFSLLQALGRPDLTAKFHLLELPVYLLLLWVLLKHMGIAGAALSWTIRMFLDAFLLFAATAWHKWVSVRSLIGNRLLESAVVLLILGGALAFPGLVLGSLWAKSMVAGFAMTAFEITSWKYLLDSRDRNMVLSAFGQFRTSFARAE
jgi:O-antigen/teichoic acid export membrane protein